MNEAVSWIESRREPWFCYVPFTAVHVPVKAPHQWLATYESGSYDDDPGKDRSYKDYAAYASHMDDAVGRLLEALMRVDQLQNTIVVFSSDNGAQRDNSSEQAALYPGLQEANLRLGSNLPLRGHKAQLYEGGIRTPSLISWPGALEPGKVSAPMHIVDWMPTLTRLIGYEPGDDPLWDGVDIWSVLASERNRGGEDRTISWNFRNSNFAVRRGDWKLIARETDGGWGDTQLYDLGSDPHETADLASKHPEMVSQLLRIVMESRELDGASARPGAPTNAGSPIFVGGPDPGSR